jgi:hypothetical protein
MLSVLSNAPENAPDDSGAFVRIPEFLLHQIDQRGKL